MYTHGRARYEKIPNKNSKHIISTPPPVTLSSHALNVLLWCVLLAKCCFEARISIGAISPLCNSIFTCFVEMPWKRLWQTMQCLDFDFLRNTSGSAFALEVLTMFAPGKLQTLQTCLLLENHCANIIRHACFLSILEAIILRYLCLPCVLMRSTFQCHFWWHLDMSSI